MRNISIQLADNSSNNVSGINRNSSSRGSIRISPPMAPNNNEIKPILRTNTSNNMRSDSENQSLNQSLNYNRISAPLLNNPMPENCDVLRNKMYCNQYYDSNNYLIHINKCQQMRKNDMSFGQSSQSSFITTLNNCALSGQSTTTSTPAVNNGITYANLNINSVNNSRGSLEDPGVDVDRLSPSTSSNDSRKSRYSSASLDSGRGSDTKTSGQSHRVSVHSCESLGSSTSNKDNYNRNSSSSSSIGSGNSGVNDGDINTISTASVSDPNWTPVSVGHSITGPLSIPEMVLHGFADEEIIHSWLSRIHLEEYTNNFIRAGYDLPTISRMTPEDLTAIGVTKPLKRQTLKNEIQRLSISDGIPNYKPNSLLEWLKILRLDEYFHILCQQGYDSIDRVCELAWEDLEEVGISKLGHQKKITLAIKRVQNLNNNINQNQGSESNKLTLPLVYTNTNGPDPSRSLNTNHHMAVNPQFQESVPIKMFAPLTKSTPSPTTEKPITPQLKTFQQLPNGYVFCRQRSEGPYYGLVSNDAQSSVFQSSRGRSLESLDNNESNYFQMFCTKQQQRHAFNGFSKPLHFYSNDMSSSDPIHGYETDSELFQSYANNRKGIYEIDGTATLHRPKGLIKAKPIAKIAAKTRPIDPKMYCNEQKNSCFDKMETNSQNSYICEENPNNYFDEMSSQIYGSLKKKKTPPPPPKRVNSMRNSANSSPLYGGAAISSFSPQLPVHHSESYDEFQEQVFATCVKSLTSRFNNSDDLSGRQSKASVDSNDFPPPPSPIHFSECQNYNTLQRRKDKNERCDRDCNISSSSSTESMPFANDNIGTIKQRNHDCGHRDTLPPSPSFTSSAPSSLTSSPSAPEPQTFSNDSKLLTNGLSPLKHPSLQSCVDTNGSGVRRVGTVCESGLGSRVDPLDDIETMLVNLSNQLDLMLETNHNNRIN